ncbi:MAG TPA: OmpA family protein, partial [Flavisolibacter sp.]|nr:OmpA family protein [Flavisolibacter sp.]
VDAHGVSLDTDGDGVPDARDKEKITPTTCQPVDADGVGKCPVICPDSTCPGFGGGWNKDCATTLGSLPSMNFNGNTSTINNDQRGMLAGVAATLRNNPNCRIQVIGYCTESKAKQNMGTNRVDNIIRHLVEREGISRDRITPVYGQAGGDCGTVDIKGE